MQEELAANRFEVSRNMVIQHCAMLTAVDARMSTLRVSLWQRTRVATMCIAGGIMFLKQ